MSGKPTTDNRGGNSSAAQSLPGAPSRAVWMGGRGGPGEGALSSPGAVSSPRGRAGGPSGLGDLLASGGAGREPGRGTLLRAEAVLVLWEVGGRGEKSSVRAGDTGENQPTAVDKPDGGPEDTSGLPLARAHVLQVWAVHVCA